MRLRARLLRLFVLFAIVPLLAIGGLGYSRSLRTLEALVESRTGVQAERMARVFRDRLDQLDSDLALVAENEETRRLLEALADGDAAHADALVRAHDRYMAELWPGLQTTYDRIVLRDQGGHPITELGEAVEAVPGAGRAVPRIVRRIPASAGSGSHGTVEAWPRLGELLRGVGFEEGFGDRAVSLLVDRERGRVLAVGGGTGHTSAGTVLTRIAPLERRSGSVGYEEGGERRVASFVSFDAPPWTIVATASVDEFADPFLAQRAVDVSLLALVILGVSAGFYVLLRRTTGSLDRLAAAAERVGRGDLAPELPPEGSDEVGQLAAAFRVMTVRLREMLAQVEAGRQTAVLGRFAVELAHEIRNPLTSVKLNLQGLERDGREGRLPEESRVAVAMALREIQRIDQALRSALKTGRPAAEPRPFAVHAVVAEAIALLEPEAASQDVAIDYAPAAARDRVRGDPDAVRGVFVNLLLNSLQAMRNGSARTGRRIHVSSCSAETERGAGAIEVRIRDEGPGIPGELRDRIFHPFFTTKEGGTGLGLSVALQTIRAAGGALRITDRTGAGAELVVTLPLEPDEESG